MTYAKLLCVGLGANWRRLWAADAISSLGDGACAAAIPLLAVYFTRSAVLVAGVATAASLPWLLCSLHAGALADRYDRRRLMSIAQIVQAVAVSIAAVTAMAPGGRMPQALSEAWPAAWQAVASWRISAPAARSSSVRPSARPALAWRAPQPGTRTSWWLAWQRARFRRPCGTWQRYRCGNESFRIAFGAR